MRSRRSTVTHRILAMKFAGEFMLIYPLYPIMFGDRGGVDAAGIGMILAAISALTVLFEIPTGIIADKISRKYVMLTSFGFKLACMIIWLAVPDFAGYMIGAVCLALSFSLESGAIQAYLYGTLGSDNKKSFGKFWSRVTAMVMLSWSLAFITTTIIGVRYPLLLSLTILACIIALIICLTLPKDNVAYSKTDVKPKIFRSAVLHITRTMELKSLLLTGILVVALAVVMTEYLSPYYHQSGVPTRWVSLCMAGGNLIGAIMFWTFHSWESYLDKVKLPLAILVAILFILSFSGGVITLCLGALLVARFVRILQIQFESKIQHLSNDESRATISSIASFASNLIAAGIMAVIGLTAVNNSILWPLRFALIGGIFLYVVLYVFDRWQSRRQSLELAA